MSKSLWVLITGLFVIIAIMSACPPGWRIGLSLIAYFALTVRVFFLSVRQ